jgi:hypothetical protein
MLTPSSHAIIFFCCAVPKTADASPSGVVNHESFFMPSPYSRSMAKPTGSKAATLFFILLIKAKLPQPLLKCIIFKVHPGGFGLHKKHKRLPVSCIKF